jgi:DNA-binding LacI/PurR family transcriptional regulator
MQKLIPMVAALKAYYMPYYTSIQRYIWRDLEAQRVIYRRQGSGIYVSPHVFRKTIAVLLDSSFFEQLGASPFWATLWGLLATEGQRRSYAANESWFFHLVSTMQGSQTALPDTLVQSISRGQVHGVLCIGLHKATAEWIESQGVATVGFAVATTHEVRLDDTAVLTAGVPALAQRGCRKIGLWMPIPANRIDTRCAAVVDLFRRILDTSGMPFHPEWITGALDIEHAAESHSAKPVIFEPNHVQGFRTAMQILSSSEYPRPDGIVVTDDMMTFGVLAACEQLGLKVGSDIQIATHANIGSHVLFGHEDAMVLIRVDPAAIVQAMVYLLDALLSGQPLDAPTVVLQPTIRM